MNRAFDSILRQCGETFRRSNHYYDALNKELNSDHYLVWTHINGHRCWDEYDTNDNLVKIHSNKNINLSFYPCDNKLWLVGENTISC